MKTQLPKTDYIKAEDLKDGYLYKILARNATYGIWKKDKGSFFISRYKFGSNFIFEEIHCDLSGHFGTVKPLKEIEKSPFSLWEEMGVIYFTKHGKKYAGYSLESELLEYLNDFDKERK